ncbi:HprK-related kinase B [Thiomicrorhabdus sp.]|uniref:HprK-related kinase B n=1 Tax=Thiomicrorhabdus sp. TaxID=2039724 RepID=UPI0029C8B325|nr:HprK-related kinase B [Thiomicrorhabdus sp.]
MQYLEALLLQIKLAHPLQSQGLRLNLLAYPIELYSTSKRVLEILDDYFGDLAETIQSGSSQGQVPKIHIYQVSEAESFIQHYPWEDWQREAGKTGRKDAIYDIEHLGQPVRFLQKVKTGMLFLQPMPNQHTLHAASFGDAEKHPNQIVNFILTQYLNHHLRNGWLLAHTSGMQLDGVGIAFAGLSGGGKSTLMLHLLAQEAHQSRFISNDRLLLQQEGNSILMRGIPKQPRINPGTIVHNPKLHPLLSAREREEFLQMDSEELRYLEQKFDADVDRLFGAGCFLQEAKLDMLVILNWQLDPNLPTELNEVDIRQRKDLISAVMKTPGPFYADNEGFLKNGTLPEMDAYLQLLQNCRVMELSGHIDFDAAQHLVLQAVETQPL